ncbi:SDR family oxidoreductase [Pseudomonas sp. G2-4]|uniref:SDR family NAD(P)-dependent oxidoreductase n=1 Tax=Pseudomonas sp. G2-4 TaxID=1506334 RepID=UPI0024BB74E0|nr:SDR family oxidoreductase [Pseudomonas sp. G2-4]WHS59424.1 SDR family oxidoreductase [Pseudomonas sp. G2-4]
MALRPPRRYWLTGAGNGVGASLAEAILDTGAHLAMSSRSAQSCEALCARYPGQVLALPGDLTDSQTVREIGEKITQQWGSLDTVILNAGTAEYSGDHPVIEHIVRSNLLVASLCIDTALPLLRAGIAPHLAGIASPATYLPPSLTEVGGSGMRYLFESTRLDLIPEDIDVTLVHPGYDNPALSHGDCFPAPVRWSAETAANHILSQLIDRHPEVALPAASMTVLWPLPSSNESLQAGIDSSQASDKCPIKGQP